MPKEKSHDKIAIKGKYVVKTTYFPLIILYNTVNKKSYWRKLYDT